MSQGGGLYNLLAVGTENLMLNGKPEISFFKTVYRRCVNFSMYEDEKQLNIQTFNTSTKIEIPRNGDLLHKMHLIVKIPQTLKFRNMEPTCKNVKKILEEYGVYWDTTQTDSYGNIIDDCYGLITLEIYNNIIVEVINQWINRYVDEYNFSNNGVIFTSNGNNLFSINTKILDDQFQNILDYIAFYNNSSVSKTDIINAPNTQIFINEVKLKLSNGIFGNLVILSELLTSYNTDYKTNYNTSLFPSINYNRYSVYDDIYKTQKNIVMYSKDFRNMNNLKSDYVPILNDMFDTGVLLKFLLAYYYDTSFGNVNPSTLSNSHALEIVDRENFFISSSLYGLLNNKQKNTIDGNFVDFPLYNFDDLKTIYFLTMMFNLIRLKLNRLYGPYGFFLDHANIYYSDVLPPLIEPDMLGEYSPFISLISENVLFYQSVDQISIKPFTTTKDNITQYFDSQLESYYDMINKYINVFPFYIPSNYVDSDAYTILKTFLTQQNQIQIITQSSLTAMMPLIFDYINMNILYNNALIVNMFSVLSNAMFKNSNHYRFTFYKNYTVKNNMYSATSGFSNNYQNITNYNSNIGDNFEYNILTNLSYNSVLGTSQISDINSNVQNYFGEAITNTIANFRTNNTNTLKVYENLGYMNDFTMWKRIIFNNDNQIEKTYLSCANSTNPQIIDNSFSEQFKQLAIMNYLPFMSVRDIPCLVSFLFQNSTIIKNVLNVLNITEPFLDLIDYRDNGDDKTIITDPNKISLKTYLYQEMINSVIANGTQVVDLDHFNSLITNTNISLTSTLRTEQVFTSLLDLSKNNDNSYNYVNIPSTHNYLPIEWINNAYYTLYANVITTYLSTINTSIIDNNLSTYNLTQSVLDTFLYCIKSCLNCFVLETSSDFPNYTTYVQNGYTLLGLTNTTGLEQANLFAMAPQYVNQIPLFCDASMSIWYQVQKTFIQNYNIMFNNVMISKNNYMEIGFLMNQNFDFIENILNGDKCIIYNYELDAVLNEEAQFLGSLNLGNTDYKSLSVVINNSAYTNFDQKDNFSQNLIMEFIINGDEKYIVSDSVNNTYQIPEGATKCNVSYVNKAGYQIKLFILVYLNNYDLYYNNDTNVYQPIELITKTTPETITPVSIGYDFYRLNNLNVINVYNGKTKYMEIYNLMTDMMTIYNYGVQYYNERKYILQFINDDKFYNRNNLSIQDYYYETSTNIIDIINQHIDYTYIDPLYPNGNFNQISTLMGTNENQYYPFSSTNDLNNFNITFTTTDKVGLSFSLTENQSDYAVGFAVGNYPNSIGLAVLKKTGTTFAMLIQYENQSQSFPIDSIDYSARYFLIQNNQNNTLSLYQDNVQIISIDSTNEIFYKINQAFKKNIILMISRTLTITIYDLYDTYNYLTLNNFNNINSVMMSLTKWFYLGLSNSNGIGLMINYIPQYQNIENILFTYYVKSSDISTQILSNYFYNTFTYNTQDFYYYGQIAKTPVIMNNDIFGYCFGILNTNQNNMYIGMYCKDINNNDVIMYIDMINKKIVNKNSTTTTEYSFDLTANLSSNDMVYFIYDGNINIYVKTSSGINKHVFGNLNNQSIKIANILLYGSTYLRFYMINVSFANGNDEIKTIFDNGLKWYQLVGNQSILSNSDFNNCFLIQVRAQIKSFVFNDTTVSDEINTMTDITSNYNDYTDISFGSNEYHLLLFNSNNKEAIMENDIIGFAFKINDNSNNIISIGLGTDTYYYPENNNILFCQNLSTDNTGDAYYLQIIYNNTTEIINFDRTPIISNTIYSVIQNNKTGSLTIFENDNEIPLLSLTAGMSQNYDNVVKILYNNSNLLIQGLTNVNFYTLKYVYTITSSSYIQEQLLNITKWYYTGATDITPMGIAGGNKLIDTTYFRFSNYLDGNIILNTENNLLYTDLLNNINKALDPKQNNLYNNNGINATVSLIDGSSVKITYYSALYGVLDNFYNLRLSGNMTSTFNSLMLELRENKIYESEISNIDNVFYSYCMYNCFRDVSSSSLTFGDFHNMALIFRNSLYSSNITQLALIKLSYIFQSEYLRNILYRILGSDINSNAIDTLSSGDHIFSASSTFLSSFVSGRELYGFGFSLSNTLNNTDVIELGIVFNHNLNQKIVLRQPNNNNYELFIKNGDYETKYLIETPIDIYNPENIFYFVINKTVGTTYPWTIQIYQNNDLVEFRGVDGNLTISDSNVETMLAGSNVNIFVKGYITINFYTLTYKNTNAPTAIKSYVLDWMNCAFDDTFISFTYYSSNTLNNYNMLPQTYYNSVSINTSNSISNEYNFLQNTILDETDIYGCSFEVINDGGIMNNISIGFNNNGRKLLISRINMDYYLVIGTYTMLLDGFSFEQGFIYTFIQNNITKTLNIYKAINGVNNLVMNISRDMNEQYNILMANTLETSVNIVIESGLNSLVNFYTPKYIYEISDIQAKILINNLTKWFYIGAQDTTPLSKIVCNPETINTIKLQKGIVYDFNLNEMNVEFSKNYSSVEFNTDVVHFIEGTSDIDNQNIYVVAFKNVAGTKISVGYGIDNNNSIIFTYAGNSYVLRTKNNGVISDYVFPSTFNFKTSSIYYIICDNVAQTISLYENNKLIIKREIGVDISLLCNLCLGGEEDTISKINIYSKNYIVQYISPEFYSTINIPELFWFGLCSNVINIDTYPIQYTSDYDTLSLSNVKINLDRKINMNSNDVLGFAFTYVNGDIQKYNANGNIIGFSNNYNNCFFGIEITKDSIQCLVNNVPYFFSKVPTFLLTNIYYFFQDNKTKTLTIYENGEVIFTINSSDSNYNSILPLFNDCYFHLGGYFAITLYNAPFALYNSSNDTQILIDNSTMWLSLGGTNTGPLLNRRMTSKQIYLDKNNTLYRDDKDDIFGDTSITSLYLFNQLLKNSRLSNIINVDYIVNSVNSNNNTYEEIVDLMNNYYKVNIDTDYEKIVKLTNVIPDRTINNFHIFLNNAYKQNFFDYNMDVYFYEPSITGTPNGVITTSDLEKRILKLIMNADPYYAWVKELGHKLIKKANIYIGDQLIDTHTSEIFSHMNKMHNSVAHERGYNMMIGNTDEFYKYSPLPRNNNELIIPFYFWFCMDVGNAYPLSASIYSPLYLELVIESLDKLLIYDPDTTLIYKPIFDYTLLCQYIYLEEEERTRMASKKLQYLIEKFNYNEEVIISYNNFLKKTVVDNVEITTPEQIDTTPPQLIYGLEKLIYLTETTINDGIITIIDKNTCEVQTTTRENHELGYAYKFNRNFGFGFTVKSRPIIDISGNIVNGLQTVPFSIGYKIVMFYYNSNNKIIQSEKLIQMNLSYMYVETKTDLFGSVPKYKKIDYITLPSFGVNDVYVCVQDDITRNFIIYENSNVIGKINFDDYIETQNGFMNNALFTREVNLYLTGVMEIDFFNCSYVYNLGSDNMRETLNNLFYWMYLGGDQTPVVDLVKNQNVLIQDTSITPTITNENGIINIGNEECLFTEQNVNNSDIIGYSFSMSSATKIMNKSFIVGLGVQDNKYIALRCDKGKYDIFITDGERSDSIALLKTPAVKNVNVVKSGLMLFSNHNIIYTIVQNNVSKIFSIYEEDELLGQINIANDVYRDLSTLFMKNINCVLINSGDNLTFTYYNSNIVYNYYANNDLKKVLNKLNIWLAIANFVPTYYIHSFRNVQNNTMTIIRDKNNYSQIYNPTQNSTDIITTEEKYNYLMQPTNTTNKNQTVGFSFSLLPYATSDIGINYDFEIGICDIKNVNKNISLKCENGITNVFVNTVENIPNIFNERYFPQTTKYAESIDAMKLHNETRELKLAVLQTQYEQTMNTIAALQNVFDENTYISLINQINTYNVVIADLKNQLIANGNNIVILERIEYYQQQIKIINGNEMIQTFNNIAFYKQKLVNIANEEKQLKQSIVIFPQNEYELINNLNVEAGNIITFVLSAPEKVLTIYQNRNIISQVCMSDNIFKDIYDGIDKNMGIFIKGKVNLRFYKSQFMYSDKYFYKNGMDYMDIWYELDVPENTDEIIKIDKFEPTKIELKTELSDTIKYLYWTMEAFDKTTEEPIDILDWAKYGFKVRNKDGDFMELKNNENMVKDFTLQINGVQLFYPLDSNYFTYVIPNNLSSAQSLGRGEYMYSFGTDTLNYQPSGHLNYSIVNNPRIEINLSNEMEMLMRYNHNIKIRFKLWGRANNILRFVSGIGGLLFFG